MPRAEPGLHYAAASGQQILMSVVAYLAGMWVQPPKGVHLSLPDEKVCGGGSAVARCSSKLVGLLHGEMQVLCRADLPM